MMTARAHPIESRLFTSYWDDGLLDVFLGVGLLGLATFWRFDLVALGAVVPAILVVLWTPLRNRLVEPRMGFVEFSDARQLRIRQMLQAAVVLGVGVLAAFIAIYLFVRRDTGEFLPLIIPGVPALLVAVPVGLGGLGLGLSRFLFYSFVLCVAGLGVALVNAEPEAAFALGGAAAVVAGGWRFGRFLRLPVETGEAD